MNQEYIISAVGKNVPGIVAKVSRAVYESGCNFEDSRMNLLGNHFALMVLITAADEKAQQALSDACERLDQEPDLNVILFEVEGGCKSEFATEANYEIRVKGIDRMGIVYRTSQLLASRNINIMELETRVETGKSGKPMFTMRTSVAVPREVDGESLRKDLKFLAEEIPETISLTRI
ncbi:MAG: ACT domain-containing protein [Desulfosalsimonas sp.]|uniref:glycine cleavage system protein R n=1 Tax=Desulfosalsimonas sp. TaxID=3073848 RepID=UPI003970D3BB